MLNCYPCVDDCGVLRTFTPQYPDRSRECGVEFALRVAGVVCAVLGEVNHDCTFFTQRQVEEAYRQARAAGVAKALKTGIPMPSVIFGMYLVKARGQTLVLVNAYRDHEAECQCMANQIAAMCQAVCGMPCTCEFYGVNEAWEKSGIM